MFRGNNPAKVDDKGRLKIPSGFKALIDAANVTQFYITSSDGKSAEIWPLPEWEKKERKLALHSTANKAVQKYLSLTSYYGQQVEMDSQARVVLPQILRDKAKLDETVERSLRGAALWEEVRDRLHTSALGLSGGQQQRLCIARAIAVEPEIILMDEPCSALDPIATVKVEELIHRLKQDYTIVIVTHNMQQAGRCSDVTAFFYMGRLIEIDATAKIFTNPSQKQTEDYISGRFG